MRDVLDLSFQLKLNCNIARTDLVKWFEEDWQDLGIQWWSSGGVGETDDNWFEIVQDYEDPTDHTTKYYLVQAISKHDVAEIHAHLDAQIVLVRDLIARLEAKGCASEFINLSSMEDYL
jgi:hypothetical protein